MKFDGYYINKSEKANTWNLIGFYINKNNDYDAVIATINIKGDINWNDSFQELYNTDSLIEKTLKHFYDNFWFNDESLTDKIFETLCNNSELYFDIMCDEGRTEYGIETINVLETLYWAYGIINTESIVFIPHSKNEQVLKNLATDIVKNIISIIKTNEFCLKIY